MPSDNPRFHPTALIDPAADLAPDVTVGPFAIVKGSVRLGPGCHIDAHAQIIGPVAAGKNNEFGRGCVIGERPQHAAYQGEPTGVVIGDGNTFREHTTVHRGMPDGNRDTVIGDGNLFLVGAHVGHDCRVGNRCVFANNALLGGHAEIADGVFLSGNSAVHQHCRVGRLALLSGCSATSKDIPPFVMQQLVNRVVGVNLIGMRRSGMSNLEIKAVRRAFAMIYRENNTVSGACLKIEAELGDSEAAREMVEFIRTSKRGICGSVRLDSTAREAAA